MFRKFFKKIKMMVTPSTDFMYRHCVRIYETPTVRPGKAYNYKAKANIKQPHGKESRGRL